MHKTSHCFLGRSVRRTVIVGQVKVGNAMVKGIMRNGPATFVRVYPTEIMPKAKADLGEQYSTVSTTDIHIIGIIIAVFIRRIAFFQVHLLLFISLFTSA